MNIILNHIQIQQKINRLGHQIIENCFEEPIIYIGGICGNGYTLARNLGDIIEKSSNQKVVIFEINVDKEEPWNHKISLSIKETDLKNAFIFIIDDVLNSGKTMQYALIKMPERPTKSIKTVALVDRTHRRYPIKADFVGISLSTTLKERVEIELNDTDAKAYLV
jgi:pyrimidine operon attenuation protein/uracil phosphoribosyltransferase